MISYDEMTREQLLDELKALRKREEYSKEQTTFMGTIYDGVASAIFVVDVTEDGGFRYTGNNLAHQLAMGFELGEIIGKTPEDLIPLVPPETVAAVIANYQRCLDEGRAIEYDEMIEVGGRPIWVFTRLIPLQNSEGQTYRIVGVSDDITARKRAEAAVQRERNLAQKYLDVAGVVLVALDAEGQITMMNPKGCEILGHSCDDILGLNWFDTFLPERIREEVREVFAQLMAGDIEPVEYFENPVLTRSGEERIIAWHNTVLRNEDGNVVGTLGFGEDVTERRAEQDALLGSEHRYHSLFQNMLNGFAYCRVIVDEDGQPVDWVYLEVNDAFEPLTGLTREGVLGKRVTEAIPGIKEAHPELFQIYGRVALTGREERFEIYFEPLDIWLSISVYSPARGDFVALFENVTERKKAEKELEKHRHHLEELVEKRTAEVREANEQLKQEVFERKQAEEALERRSHDLGERVKELSCLYGVSSLASRQDASLDDLLAGTVSLIPPSWQYPEIACARIVRENQEFRSDNFVETQWKQSREIIVHGEPVGAVEVCYLEEKPDLDEGPFLKEERKLIDAIAERLGRIIERKTAEEELDRLFNLVPDMIAVTSSDGYFKRVNHAWEETLGHTTHDLLSRPFLDFVHPDDRGPTTAEVERQLAGQPTIHFENRYICRDGSYRWLEWVATLAEDGDLLYGAARDITERREMEQALRDSEDKYRTLFETMAQGVVYQRADGEITSANPAAERILGLTLDQMQGRASTDPRWRAVHEDGSPFPGETHPSMVCLRSGEKVSNVSMGVFNPDTDEYRWIDINAVPQFKPGDDKPFEVYTTFEDVTERRAAEEALRESEELTRVTLSSISDAVFVTDDAGEFVFICPNVDVIFGYSTEELQALGNISRVLGDGLFAPEELEALGEIRNIEHEIADREGRTHSLLTNVKDVSIRGGTQLYTCRDITGRKQAEARVKEMKESYDRLTDNADEAIFRVDAEGGHVVYVNAAAERIFGYSLAEYLSDPDLAFKVIHPDSRERQKQIIKEVSTAKRTVKNAVLTWIAKDGSEVTMEYTIIPVVDEQGKVACFESIGRDITERQAAREALQESEAKYRAIFAQAADSIVLVDADEGKFVEFNDRAHDSLGYSREEFQLLMVSDIEVTESPQEVVEHIEMILNEGADTFETKQATKDGQVRDILVNSRFVSIADRSCILSMWSDITDRKQMETELRQLYDEEKELRQKLETEIGKRVEFTRTLTHELKTPLTSVLASSDLLASEVRDPNLQSLASSISRSAANLNSRVDELLDLAKGEIGTLELNLEEVEVSQLLREAAEIVTPLASKRQHSLAVDVPAVLPIVRADPVRLHQVVGNLLSNAIKFAPKGGKITLRGRREGAAIVVEVEDTGRGLSKEEQKRVFEPYHRLEGDRQRLSGLGLGLPLCKSLVELHGGQIWVKSAVGKGSTFCFSLPLDTADEAPTEAPETKHLWKVLMIEDDPEIVNFVSTAFRMRWPEAQLISTDQGQDGVDLVEREKPDIVLLDLGLPDTSGFEVLRQIRLFSAVPVVILTVRAEEDDIVRGLEWGADDYMVKPFRQMELLARLKVQLRKQTAPDEEAPIVCGLLRFDPPTAQLTLGGKEISFTVIEGHIIRCLMINAGHVVTHARLAEAVWGEDYPGALDSLRVNIRRMRTKLEDDPKKPELILTKPGVGYMLAKPV